jgi:hypothetical protein
MWDADEKKADTPVYHIEAAWIKLAPKHVTGRVALVVGNATYDDRTMLAPHAEAKRDAEQMSARLSMLGYKLIGDKSGNIDVSKAQFDDLVQDLRQEFSALSSQKDAKIVAVFYFSGHGATTFRDASEVERQAVMSRDGRLLDIQVRVRVVDGWVNAVTTHDRSAKGNYQAPRTRPRVQEPCSRGDPRRVQSRRPQDQRPPRAFFSHSEADGQLLRDAPSCCRRL